MLIRKALAVAFATCIAFPAFAGPATDALGACLADNTSGKERKELARWIFVAVASHPDIQDISRVPPALRVETDRQIGQIVSRLLTQNCVAEARTAMKSEGSGAFKGAFSTLGQLAFQELMSNQDVAASLTGWEKYFDHQKFEAAMSSK